MPGPTRAVSIHQNIGVVVMRFHSAVRGRLCRECIEAQFWKKSLTTLFLGWWGVISFFTTPIFLFANAIALLSAAGLPSSSTGRAKPVGAVVGPLVIAGILGGMIFAVVGISNLSQQPVEVPAGAVTHRQTKQERCIASCDADKAACLKTACPGCGQSCLRAYNECRFQCEPR